MQVKKKQLELDMEQWTSSNWERSMTRLYIVTLLTYMQSTSCEAQAGIKIARRNINNLRCADDTTFMAESEEELKSLDESEREQ